MSLTEPTLYRHWTEIPDGVWRWRNFRPQEIACRGSGAILIDPVAMDRLQALRDRLGVPVMVNSGYRSPAHNRKVGGEPDSEHLNGRAFDISMSNHDPHAFEEAARAAGFRGFGFYPMRGFMHIDIGASRTWGTPWPKAAEAFPVEAAPPREDIKESRTIQGGKVAAGATAAGAAINLPEVMGGITWARNSIGDWLPDPTTMRWVLALFVLAAVGYIVWARLDDWRRKRR